MSDPVLEALDELKQGQARIEKKVDELRNDLNDHRRVTTDSFSVIADSLNALRHHLGADDGPRRLTGAG